MEFDRGIKKFKTGMWAAIAIGILASLGNGDDKVVNKTKFLAHCPGGQEIAYTMVNDREPKLWEKVLGVDIDQHQATMTCAEDGSTPDMGIMSDEWQDDDPQTLVDQINNRFPGRVIVEVATDQMGDKFTGLGEKGFFLGNINREPTQPKILTEEHPIDKIQTFTPR